MSFYFQTYRRGEDKFFSQKRVKVREISLAKKICIYHVGRCLGISRCFDSLVWRWIEKRRELTELIATRLSLDRRTNCPVVTLVSLDKKDYSLTKYPTSRMVQRVAQRAHERNQSSPFP